jgi:hypothetical protein
VPAPEAHGLAKDAKGSARLAEVRRERQSVGSRSDDCDIDYCGAQVRSVWFPGCHAVGVIGFNGKSILSAHTESNKGTSEGDGLETARPVKYMVNGLDLLPVI